MNRIYFLSDFLTSDQKHGGVGRAGQVFELLSSCGEVVNVAELSGVNDRKKTDKSDGSKNIDYWKGLLKKFKIIILGLNPFLSASLKRFKKVRGIYSAGLSEELFRELCKSGFGPNQLLVVEAQTARFCHLMAKAIRRGGKVVAVPQNIDSLVTGYNNPATGENALDWFFWEIKRLKKSIAVFCISREERWLLNIWKCNAHYLPYYPTRHRQNELLSIRKQRSDNSGEILLVMGSASNPPTGLGLLELADYLKQPHECLTQFKIVIVGNGTEKYRKDFENHAEVLGSVSDELMNKLWIRSIACLIHQLPTSGVLTKIPELLLAGIPVVANVNAARSYYDLNGVYVYEDLAELSIDLIKNLTIPELPQFDGKDINNFCSFIKNNLI